MGSTEPLGLPLRSVCAEGSADDEGLTRECDASGEDVARTQVDGIEEGPCPLPDLPEPLLSGYLEAAILVVRGSAPHELPRALRPYRNWTVRGFRRPLVLLQLRRSLEEDGPFRDMVDRRVLAAQKELATAVREGRCDEVSDDAEPLVLAAVGIALGSQGGSAVDAAARSARPEPESGAGPPGADRALHAAVQRIEKLESAGRELRQRLKDARDALREHEREARQLRAKLHAAQERAVASRVESAAQREEAEREMAQLAAQMRDERRLRVTAQQRLAEVQRLRVPEEMLADMTGAFHEVERALSGLGDRIQLVVASPRDTDPRPSAEAGSAAPGKTASSCLAGGLRSNQSATPSQAPKRQPTTPVRSAANRAAPVRHPLAVPFGRLQEDPETLHAWAATSGTVVLVDGYNVTLHPQGFSALALAQQRTVLLERCERLVRATGAQVLVVFDGAEVGPTPNRMGSGRVRVVFTEAGRTADDEIVALARHEPVERPVVVVSTDNEVRARCRALGASTVPSAALLRWDRR